MKIACPECDTSFMVALEQLGPEGRKVKCSKCNCIWHQLSKTKQIRAESIFSIDNKFKPIGSGVNLPALLPIKFSVRLYIFPIIIILMILLLSFILWHDRLNIFLGSKETELDISDLFASNMSDINKIVVGYKITNNSDHEIVMPSVRIRLLDKNKKLLESYLANQNNITLYAKEFLYIKTDLINIPPEAQEVDVSLGNRLNFILR